METTFSNRRPTHKMHAACAWRQRECGTNGLIRFDGKVNEKTGEMSYGFASNLRVALPNASLIGFTGTPIEKMDANTRKRQRRGLIPAWGNAPGKGSEIGQGLKARSIPPPMRHLRRHVHQSRKHGPSRWRLGELIGPLSRGVAPCWHGAGPLALTGNLRDALPKASFIGFTGTPIEKADANMRAVFGEDCGAVLVDRHTPMSWIGGLVFHLPLVKSGKSTEKRRNPAPRSWLEPCSRKARRRQRLRANHLQIEEVMRVVARIGELVVVVADRAASWPTSGVPRVERTALAAPTCLRNWRRVFIFDLGQKDCAGMCLSRIFLSACVDVGRIIVCFAEREP